MPELSVNFMHPTDGRVMTVVVDDAMTAEEIVENLIENGFVPQHPEGYELAIVEAEKTIIRADQTLAEAGARSGAKIQVLPSTPAGGR